MPRVVAFDDAKAHQSIRALNVKTPFLSASAEASHLPVAFIIKDTPQRTTPPHYHAVDQFQVVIEGKGKFGRHAMAPYSVHFSRAYTPYGPLLPAEETGGWAFLTLRAHFDPGANFFPEAKAKLKQMANHRPWQIMRQVQFLTQPESMAPGEVMTQEIPDIHDDQGLFVSALSLAPGARTAAPDPARGDGQYLAIVKGSLWHADKEHKACTLIFVEPQEGSFALHAGDQGLQAIVMNFPRNAQRISAKPATGVSAGFKKWQCQLCAFSYDEALGLPEEGIPAGTRWQDVPETWSCPDCSASKGDFQMVEI